MCQLLYVLVNIKHDLVLPQGLCEGFDGRDLVHSHYDIQNPKKLCIGRLNTSDEWRELLIIPDLHLNPCFVKLGLWLHLLVKVKPRSLVPHCPFLHMCNSSVNVFECSGCLCALLFKAM